LNSVFGLEKLDGWNPIRTSAIQSKPRPMTQASEDSGTVGFDLGAPFSWLEKPRNRMRRDLNCMAEVRIPPISVSASIATFQSRNADAPLMLRRHPKKDSFKTTVIPCSGNGWSVVRSASLAKGGTSKKRPSPHLRRVPNRSSKASPRTLKTALVFFLLFFLSVYFVHLHGA
jgi:hypothetical protein